MKKENEQKIKDYIWQLENSVGKPHADYTTSKHIADVLFLYLEGRTNSFKELWLDIKYRYKIKRAALLHQECCGVDKKEW